MPETISVDEFLSQRSVSAKDGVLYRAAKMPKTFDPEARSATFVMSDETVDSYGDILRAKGCVLDRFLTNPIALLNHSYNQMIGTWADVEKKQKRVEGTVTLAAEGTSPVVDMTFNLMSQGILRAASVGLMPIKVERRLDENGEPLWAYDILEWEMIECSVVAVPANPSALAKSMSEGCVMARDLLEQVLDTYVKTPTGLIVPIAEVEKAYLVANGSKTIRASRTNDESDREDVNPVDEAATSRSNLDLARHSADIDLSLDVDEKSIDEIHDTVGSIPVGTLSVDVDISEAERKLTGISRLFDTVLLKARELAGLTEKPEPEPELVPEAMERAKALREKMAARKAA